MLYLKFLWSLLRHKWFVLVECCRLGIPWRGLMHDWSKFLPSEFIPRARYLHGCGDKHSFDVARLHHQHKNRHHWEYWIGYNGSVSVAYPMPDRYRREMLAGWRGTRRTSEAVVRWYKDHRDDIVLHPDTRAWVEDQLGV